MDVKKAPPWLISLFRGENRVRLIVALGMIGMALILLSHFLSPGEQKKPEVDTATADFTTEQYITDLEAKLESLISGMDGVGSARVMVTLESGVEYVYLQEEKRSADTSREAGDEAAGRVSSKENVEQKYILVEQDGKKQPVLRTQLEPRVQGVVVVCEGAENARVQQALINVVTTALNISSNRVCVVKIDLSESSMYTQEEIP